MPGPYRKIDRSLRSWAYGKNGALTKGRQRRMARFISALGITPETKVIDLGGTPSLWIPLGKAMPRVTIVNLPTSQFLDDTSRDRRFRFIAADATNLAGVVRDQEYDVAFSNSVIEHVGEKIKRTAFASEVKRIAPKHWIQTPCPYFPIEVHTSVPLYWYLPKPFLRFLRSRWQSHYPAWEEMIAGTRPVYKAEMKELFPNSKTITEYLFGIPKSFVSYRS